MKNIHFPGFYRVLFYNINKILNTFTFIFLIIKVVYACYKNPNNIVKNLELEEGARGWSRNIPSLPLPAEQLSLRTT